MARPRVVLTLEFIGPDPARALRPALAMGLKFLLRECDWRCLSIRDADPALPGPADLPAEEKDDV